MNNLKTDPLKSKIEVISPNLLKLTISGIDFYSKNGYRSVKNSSPRVVFLNEILQKICCAAIVGGEDITDLAPNLINVFETEHNLFEPINYALANGFLYHTEGYLDNAWLIPKLPSNINEIVADESNPQFIDTLISMGLIMVFTDVTPACLTQIRREANDSDMKSLLVRDEYQFDLIKFMLNYCASIIRFPSPTKIEVLAKNTIDVDFYIPAIDEARNAIMRSDEFTQNYSNFNWSDTYQTLMLPDDMISDNYFLDRFENPAIDSNYVITDAELSLRVKDWIELVLGEGLTSSNAGIDIDTLIAFRPRNSVILSTSYRLFELAVQLLSQTAREFGISLVIPLVSKSYLDTSVPTEDEITNQKSIQPPGLYLSHQKVIKQPLTFESYRIPFDGKLPFDKVKNKVYVSYEVWRIIDEPLEHVNYHRNISLEYFPSVV